MREVNVWQDLPQVANGSATNEQGDEDQGAGANEGSAIPAIVGTVLGLAVIAAVGRAVVIAHQSQESDTARNKEARYSSPDDWGINVAWKVAQAKKNAQNDAEFLEKVRNMERGVEHEKLNQESRNNKNKRLFAKQRGQTTFGVDSLEEFSPRGLGVKRDLKGGASKADLQRMVEELDKLEELRSKQK